MSLRSKATELFWHQRWEKDPGPFDAGQVKKILVVRNDNIGDVICTTPALDALRNAFPKAHIAALVCTLARDAIEGHRALDALYVYPKAKHKVHGLVRSHVMLAGILSKLKKERFDLALALRFSFSGSQAWLAYASGARWRVGPMAKGKRAGMGFYYNLPCEHPPADMHEVRRCFHYLKKISVDTEPKSLYLKVPGWAMQKAQGFLAENGLRADKPPVVVNITRWAYAPDRLWPEERWPELLTGLQKHGMPLVVTHAPADAAWVAGLLSGVNPAPPVFCSQSLKEFGAMVSLGRPFVTIDGGPMHIAAAVGASEVVLWGRTPLEVWKPWGVKSRNLRSGGHVSHIQVDEVLAAVKELSAL